jgi:hypothetical protein
MSGETLTPPELRRAGLEALHEKLGLVGMIRFLQQFETGKGDYTAERHAWLDGQTIEDIRERIRSSRLESNQPSSSSADD